MVKNIEYVVYAGLSYFPHRFKVYRDVCAFIKKCLNCNILVYAVTKEIVKEK